MSADASPPDSAPPPDGDAVYQQLLVVRSQLGDRAALGEIVALWERRLAYYVRRLLDDATTSHRSCRKCG